MESHLSGVGFLDVQSILDTVTPAVEEGVSTTAGGVLQAALTGGSSEDYEAALRAGGATAIQTALPPTMSQVPTGPGANMLPTTGANALPIVSPNGMPIANGRGMNKTLVTVGLLAAAGVGAWWFMKRRKRAA